MQFCYNWYPPKKRPLHLSLLSISNIIGGGAGNFLPLFFVDESVKDPDRIRSLTLRYNFIMFFVWAGLFAANLIFFKGGPDDMEEEKQPK